MGLVTGFKGLVRGAVDELRSMMVGRQGDLKISHFLPDYAQLVAEGRVWRVQEATGTNSVTDLPTDAALLTVGNNEPADGLWYIGMVAYAWNGSNAAAIENFSLAACIGQLPALTGGLSTTLAQDIAKTSIKSMLGVRGGAYNGRAVVDTGVTITDDLWFPVGRGSGSTAVASAKGGATIFEHLNGAIILPPKSIIAFASTATSTDCVTRKGFIWAEVPRHYLLGQ